MSEVRHARARKVTLSLEGESDAELEADGEIVGRLPAEFEILPGALRVRSPR